MKNEMSLQLSLAALILVSSGAFFIGWAMSNFRLPCDRNPYRPGAAPSCR
jgi:hypothetical protein